MTKKLPLLLALLIYTATADAQRMWLMEGDSTLVKSSVVIDLSGEGGWRSNAIDSEMLDKLVFGGHIDRDLIDRQEARIGNSLRVGAGYGGQLRFLLMRDSVVNLRDWGWQVQIEQREHLELAAPSDLYHLLFRGNNPDFLGQSAELGETWIDRATYQKFGFGMLHKPTLSGFVLSAVNGQSFERMYLTQGSLFTSESADSIAVEGDGHWIYSDREVAGLGAGNGIGISLDAVFNLPLQEDRGFVSIGVRDLGFVQWNEATTHSRLDTTWSFTGVPVNELIDLGGDALPQFDDSLFLDTEQGAEMRWLPGYAYARLLHTIGERDFFEVMMVFRPVNAFVPLFSASYHYRLPKRVLLGGGLRYGGYGGVRAGISAEAWLGKRVFAALTTEDVLGWMSPRARGMQAGFRLTYLVQTP